MQKVLLLLWTIMIPVLLLGACSSVPKPRGYQKYYGINEDTYSFIRKQQIEANKRRFPSVTDVLKNHDDRLQHADCFRLQSVTTQWGLYEPQVLFIGESIFSADKMAYIFVPPVFEDNDDYPNPTDAGKYSVFRLDPEAPFSQDAIRQLQSIVGDQRYCAQLVRTETTETPKAGVLTALRVTEASKAQAPRPKTPEKPLTSPATSSAPKAL